MTKLIFINRDAWLFIDVATTVDGILTTEKLKVVALSRFWIKDTGKFIQQQQQH
jgi:hypothetical protein